MFSSNDCMFHSFNLCKIVLQLLRSNVKRNLRNETSYKSGYNVYKYQRKKYTRTHTHTDISVGRVWCWWSSSKGKIYSKNKKPKKQFTTNLPIKVEPKKWKKFTVTVQFWRMVFFTLTKHSNCSEIFFYWRNVFWFLLAVAVNVHTLNGWLYVLYNLSGVI